MASRGFLSALVLYCFINYFYMKLCDFNSSYEGDMFEDPLDVFITKIGYVKGTIFYLDGMSKLGQRTLIPKWRMIENQKFNVTLILLLSGDVSMNPGPIRNPCIGCGRPVKCNQQALMCDFCDKWVHRKCTNPLVCESDFFKLEDSTDNFFCQACMYMLPEFSESFFHDSSLVDETFSSSLSNLTNISGEESESCLAYTDPDQNMSRDVKIDVHDQGESSHDVFQELRQTRLKYKTNTIITYLNVNSIQYKFMEVGELLYDKFSDICIFAETKLDDTFNQLSFNVVDYMAFRNDRNASGGGLMAYVDQIYLLGVGQILTYSGPSKPSSWTL